MRSFAKHRDSQSGHDRKAPGAARPAPAFSCPVCETDKVHHFLRIDDCDYWRCEICEATVVDPAQLPEAAVEQAQYQLHRNDPDEPGYRAFLARLAAPLLERLAPGTRGLDYGCGPGPALAAMLREAGHTMAIYDPLFFDDPVVLHDRYDFITCTEVAEHFHRPASEFCRLGQLLAPGGWLAVMTQFQTDNKAFARWHYRRDPTHVVFYRAVTFQTLAYRHGWRCEIPCANVALLYKPQLRDDESCRPDP